MQMRCVQLSWGHDECKLNQSDRLVYCGVTLIDRLIGRWKQTDSMPIQPLTPVEQQSEGCQTVSRSWVPTKYWLNNHICERWLLSRLFVPVFAAILQVKSSVKSCMNHAVHMSIKLRNRNMSQFTFLSRPLDSAVWFPASLTGYNLMMSVNNVAGRILLSPGLVGGWDAVG